VVIQGETLCILRISVLCYLLRELFENLLARPVYDQCLEFDQNLIKSFMYAPAKIASIWGVFATKGASPKAMSMEVPIAVPKA